MINNDQNRRNFPRASVRWVILSVAKNLARMGGPAFAGDPLPRKCGAQDDKRSRLENPRRSVGGVV